MELIGGAGVDAATQAGPRASALADGATASRLDGGRLFLQHGPINCAEEPALVSGRLEKMSLK